jgi:hypothetical protein
MKEGEDKKQRQSREDQEMASVSALSSPRVREKREGG